MESPYELARNILLSDENTPLPESLPGRFKSIDLYGDFAHEKDTADGIHHDPRGIASFLTIFC